MAVARFAALPEVERLSPVCIRILGGNPSKFTLQGTNTYLLGQGQRRLLIDSGEGMPSWIAAIKSTLDKENATIETALITHWHHDHQGGIKHLLQHYPGAKVYKNNPGESQLPVADGDKFSVEGVTLTAVHTPGHTTDHMAFVLEEEDAMFTGDNVLGHGTAVFEDLATYLNSLERMKRLFKGRAYPGHGPVLQDGPSKIVEYIEHRRLREEQVIQTIRSPKVQDEAASQDGWPVMGIVKLIYRDVPEDLHPAAAGGVIQILCKLEKEGRVVAHEDRWSYVDRSTL
jgi:endoribonuclease LACTB2